MGALDGKVAIVTAAAGVGIGQAVARCFAAEGAAVVVTDAHARRVHEVGEAMSKDYGRDFLAMEVNVADSEQVNAMARAVLD
ncbi:MAG: SDR family NAD(P)-dependent oxidoreductase, partial [Dehalococcoidia bacterium]